MTLAALPSTAGAGELRLLAIAVNGQPSNIVAPVLMIDDQVHMTPDVFERLRIRLPNMTAIEHQGARYYPLSGHPDTSHRIDQRVQAIDLIVPARHMMSTTISAARRRTLEPVSSDFGGFLNYDLLGEWLEEGEDEYSADGLFEAGIFMAGFVTTTTQALRNFEDDPEYVRLESTLVRDVPEERLTYRFGDSISRGGQWGRPIRFGGFQIGSNFDTQPDFLTFPTVSLSGDAALPSSLDVLVANSSRFSDNVPAGPFVIEDVPVVTGAGEVTAVVTDVLGRETVISQAYYVSPSLLREGLVDFSFEVGLPRQDFGIDSNDYENTPVLAGTYRHGYSDSFTGELHTELDEDRQALGFGFAAPVDVYGVVSGAVAGSLGEESRGGLFQLGFERSARDVSVTAFGRLTTGNYTDLGVEEDLQSSDAEGRFQVSLPLDDFGVISSSYSYRNFKGLADDHIVSGTYSFNIPGIGALNVTALSNFGESDETVVTTNLTIPLGARTSASGRMRFSEGPEVLKTVDVRHTAPLEGGFGGAASVSDNGFTRTRGEVSYSSQIGVASVEASHVGDDTGVRVNAVGGVAFADGGAFLSRRINDSFAIASVPDQAGVRVYSENRLIGTTDSNGQLLIHNLRAYETNRIRIDPRDLPLDADVGRTSITVAPRFRSGVTVEFPIETSRSALLSVYLEDGRPVPPGAAARLVDGPRTFPFGFDGQVLVRGIKLGDQIVVDLGQQGSCAFIVDREIPNETIPDLGRFTCRGGN